MSRLTSKQRKKIYLELAANYADGLKSTDSDEFYFEPKGFYRSKFICVSLINFFRDYFVYNPLEDFPELAYFEPLATDDKDEGCEGGWFTIEQQHGFEERVMTLLFCAEMCDENLEILK